MTKQDLKHNAIAELKGTLQQIKVDYPLFVEVLSRKIISMKSPRPKNALNFYYSNFDMIFYSYEDSNLSNDVNFEILGKSSITFLRFHLGGDLRCNYSRWFILDCEYFELMQIMEEYLGYIVNVNDESYNLGFDADNIYNYFCEADKIINLIYEGQKDIKI